MSKIYLWLMYDLSIRRLIACVFMHCMHQLNLTNYFFYLTYSLVQFLLMFCRFAGIRFVFRHIVNGRIGERVPKLASDDTRYLNQQFDLQTNRMQC